MVAVNKFSRKTVRKVDLPLALEDRVTRDQLQQDVLRDRQRSELMAVTGSTDIRLIEQMIDLGFHPGHVGALRYAPIAAVSWASGRVTDREHIIAVSPTLTEELFHEPQAAELFRSWLSTRPSEVLWTLWEDYTKDAFSRGDAAAMRQFGEQLYRLATRVALASGGLLNQGDICLGEQRVLKRIADVYQLDESEFVHASHAA